IGHSRRTHSANRRTLSGTVGAAVRFALAPAKAKAGSLANVAKACSQKWPCVLPTSDLFSIIGSSDCSDSIFTLEAAIHEQRISTASGSRLRHRRRRPLARQPATRRRRQGVG